MTARTSCAVRLHNLRNWPHLPHIAYAGFTRQGKTPHSDTDRAVALARTSEPS